jgi:mono/diheme cytochrome c family protein
MARCLRIALLVLPVVVAAAALSACGSEEISASVTPPYRSGAQLFADRCGGCHTLKAAGTQGTSENKKDRERVDGPDLDKRKETIQCVLYAIRNGGFSGAIMPQNIVTGAEAQQVAGFVARYAGEQSKTPAVCGGGK